MTKTTEENLSQSKYAEHRNVTKGYIGRMVKEGRLHLIKGKLNVKMSDAELDMLLKRYGHFTDQMRGEAMLKFDGVCVNRVQPKSGVC